MKDLIILGTGVHAGEMAEIVERINKVQPTWNLLGFITPSESKVGEIFNGYPVLGTRDVLCAYPGVSLVSDNEWPYQKRYSTGKAGFHYRPLKFRFQDGKHRARQCHLSQLLCGTQRPDRPECILPERLHHQP